MSSALLWNPKFQCSLVVLWLCWKKLQSALEEALPVEITEATTEVPKTVSGGNTKLLKPEPALADLAAQTYDHLKTAEPSRMVSAHVQSQHPISPHLPKLWWTGLGDVLKQAESSSRVPGDKYYTLRLDGTGFSKYIPRLRKQGIFAQYGYCPVFANIMVEVSKALMAKFSAVVAYTQSDEITLVVLPMPVTKEDNQEPHMYSGRNLKLCTLAAATATAVFNRRIFELLQDGEDIRDQELQRMFATFDCRMACFDSEREALSLVVWRSYDCSTNAVSDAVHHATHLDGRKAIMKKGTGEKLAWLAENSMLPLPYHQAVGSLLIRKTILTQGVNPKTKETVEVMRSVIHKVPGNFLQLCKENETKNGHRSSVIDFLADHAVIL